MGTSASYPGPAGRNPLLPPWADQPTPLPSDEGTTSPPPLPDAAGSDEGQSAASVGPTDAPTALTPTPLPNPRPWRAAKVAMTRIARSGARNDARIRGLGRRFVSSLGGSRRAAASSVSARATARRLGGFLAGVARDGVVRTLERLGLTSHLGRPISALLTALGRVIAPPGDTADDAIAATAFHETMASLMEDLAIEENGIEALSRIDEELLRVTMKRFVANVVITRLLHVLSAELEAGAISADRAVAVEFEIRDFVEAAVDLTVGREQLADLDWDSPRAKAIADDLVRQGYEVFEVGQ